MRRIVLLVLGVVALAAIGSGVLLYQKGYFGRKVAPVVFPSVKAPEPDKKVVKSPEKYHTYKIKRGDTLSGISRNYGMDLKTIAVDNDLKDPNRIYAGKTLKLRLSVMGKKPVLKKVAPKEEKVAPKRVAFQEWISSLWKRPGANAYKGGMKNAKKPENVREALVAKLGKTKYRSLIPVFEEMIRNKQFFLKDIQKGEVFDLMVSTKKGKTVVGRKIKEAWDPKWVRKHKVSREAERYVVEFEGEEVMLTFAYACGNWAITFRPLPPPPPVVVKPKKSWLEITKEIFSSDDQARLRDREGNLLPVPAFTFIVTNLETGVQMPVTMDSSGYKEIEVDPGTYLVEEPDYPGWSKFLVTPPSGTVTLEPGERKSVNFKNQQLPPPPIEPPVTELPPPEEPPEIITPPPPAPPLPPVTAVPPPERKIKKVAECVSQEHEPIGGIFWGSNDVAKSQYVYGEYMDWLRSRTGKCDGNFWGIGVFGGYGAGDVKKSSSFEWREWQIGPQFGAKGYRVGTDKDGKFQYSLWQMKLRAPVYNEFMGENDRLGIKSTQRTVRGGLYAEIEKGNQQSSYGAFAEGWLDFRRKGNFNFVGGSVDKRDSAIVGVYVKKKLTKHVSGRVIAGGFYERWHDLFGFQLNAEVGLWDIVYCGPGVKLYPWSSSELREDGVSLSEINPTVIGSCRVELQPLIQGWLYKRNKKEIKVIEPGSPEDFVLPEQEEPEEQPGIVEANAESQPASEGIVPAAEAGTLHTENSQDSDDDGDEEIGYIDPKIFE